MLARTFVRSLGRSKMQIQSAVAMTQSRRNFGEALTIPTDREQQAGRRKEELDAEAAGQIGFNRDPIVPASDAGSKENPILVRQALNLLFCDGHLGNVVSQTWHER